MPERTLLIFGGTFDPPHHAHLDLPEAARTALHGDKILYIPAGVPPHKLDQTITPAHHRLAMLRLALKGRPHTAIDTREIDAPPDSPSYTCSTLEALRAEHPPTTRLRLLIGSDQAVVFHTWREPDRIEQLAPPAVMIRPPLTQQAFLDALPADQRPRWADRLVTVPPSDLSATSIRDAIRAGGPVPASVPEPVRHYILEHRLYQA